MAKDLSGVTSQLRKHEALLHELAATEQQVAARRFSMLFIHFLSTEDSKTSDVRAVAGAA